MMNMLLEIYNLVLKEFGSQKWWPIISKNKRFEIMVGAILTQNTAWKNVEKAIENLDREGLLDLERMHETDTKGLARLIRAAGYYNQKAKKLKNFTKFLIDKYDGDIKKMFRKNTIELRKELLSVNGIGPETADSILLYAGCKPVFVVDAYTKRVFSRIGLISKDASYDKIQEFFMKNLPKDYKLFNEYHALIVMLGKSICKKEPNCGDCPINGFCKRKIYK